MPPLTALSWDTLVHQWMADYRPQRATDQQTILRAAHADWSLRIEEQQYAAVESALRHQYGPITAWSDAPHRHLRLFHQRLQRAQSSFLRWQRAAERLRPKPTNKVEAADEQLPKSTYKHTPAPFVQYMEAFVEDGVTHTVYNPPHQNLLAAFEQAPPDKKILRTLCVLLPIPPEYEWLTVPDGEDSRLITWSSTVEECRPDLLRDLAEGNGHVLPSPHMLPKGVDQSDPQESSTEPQRKPYEL